MHSVPVASWSCRSCSSDSSGAGTSLWRKPREHSQGSSKHVKPTAGGLHATQPTSHEFDMLGDLSSFFFFFFWHFKVPQMKIRNSLIQEALWGSSALLPHLAHPATSGSCLRPPGRRIQLSCVCWTLLHQDSEFAVRDDSQPNTLFQNSSCSCASSYPVCAAGNCLLNGNRRPQRVPRPPERSWEWQ